MKNIYAYLVEAIEKEKTLALATIIETRGSTPQVPGASALFTHKGLLQGTLGGGFMEADAQEKTIQAIEKKQSKIIHTYLQSSIKGEGAICGGEALILVDIFPGHHRNTFQNAVNSLHHRLPGVLVTEIKISSEEKISISRSWMEKGKFSEMSSKSILGISRREIEDTLVEGKPRLLKTEKELHPEKEEALVFLEPLFPLPQLVIAGAGHIGQVVAHLGNLLNFEVTVIDDRQEFANKERLPGADHIIVDEVGKAMQQFPISQDTYVVIVTRGHRHDAEALRSCITSEAAYIGMIGSQRKIQLMRSQFLEEGWATPKQFDRIYAPIGIDIHSKTVEEIALSIAAQLVLVRSQARTKQKQE